MPSACWHWHVYPASACCRGEACGAAERHDGASCRCRSAFHFEHRPQHCACFAPSGEASARRAALHLPPRAFCSAWPLRFSACSPRAAWLTGCCSCGVVRFSSGGWAFAALSRRCVGACSATACGCIDDAVLRGLYSWPLACWYSAVQIAGAEHRRFRGGGLSYRVPSW